MQRYMFLWVLLGTLVLVALGVFVIPGKRPEGSVRLPWQIEQVNGSLRVFDLTLGESTLADAERVLGEEAEISLFRSPDDRIDIEAYFDQATLSGLRAKVVVAMAIPDEDKRGMYDRGIRVATMGGGIRKVTLAPDDVQRVRHSPIANLTYLPRIDLEPELLAKRFGEPTRRIDDPEEGITHWLYPSLGLDIAVHEKGKEVFLYIPPSEFGQAVEPLERADEGDNGSSGPGANAAEPMEGQS